MLDEDGIGRVRALWRDLMVAPDGFTQPGAMVVAAPGHRAAPPGWVGVVEILGAVVVAAPPELVDTLRMRVADAPSVQALTDAAASRDVLGPIAAVLGPAVLFYGDAASAARSGHVVGPLALSDDRVQAVLASATPVEVVESGLADTTSGVWLALSDDGTPAALCAWREWPHRVAHICVVTATAHRGRGHAAAAASAALDAACADSMLPQWRAAETNVASAALAARLGLHPVGRQLSILLA